MRLFFLNKIYVQLMLNLRQISCTLKQYHTASCLWRFLCRHLVGRLTICHHRCNHTPCACLYVLLEKIGYYIFHGVSNYLNIIIQYPCRSALHSQQLFFHAVQKYRQTDDHFVCIRLTQKQYI